MKNGFSSAQEVGFTNPHSPLNYSPAQQQSSSNGYVQDVEVNQGMADLPIIIHNGHTSIGNSHPSNEGLHARKMSSTVERRASASGSAASSLKFAGTKDAFSTYDVLWCRTKNWMEAMKHVPWKNSRALPGRAYTPTEVSVKINYSLAVLLHVLDRLKIH